MKFNSEGRFCSSCQVNVIDYTNKSKEELSKVLKETKPLCGRFTIEQIDSTLIAPIEFPKKIKIMTLIISFAFSIVSKNSFGRINEVRTEQTIHSLDSIVNVIPCDTNALKSTNESVSFKKKPLIKTRRKRIYLTSRFPFIKTVYFRKTIVGRFL
jgi:hypothetical protein